MIFLLPLTAFLFVLWTYLNAPFYYSLLISEDLIGETFTFLAYMFSAVLILVAVYQKIEFRKPGFIVFAFLLAFIAMEEISWGQRLFGFETPYRLGRLSTQGELNLHNLWGKQSILAKVFSCGILAWMSGRFWVRFPFWQNAVKKWGIPLCVRGAYPFLVIGIILNLAPTSVIIRKDEIAELFLACGFLFQCMVSFNYRLTHRKIISFVIVLCALLLFNYYRFGARENLKINLNVLAYALYPAQGLYDPAERLFEFLLANPSWQKRDALFNYAMFLSKKKDDRARSVAQKALIHELESHQSELSKAKQLIRLGRLYEVLGEPIKAKSYWQEAIALDLDKLVQEKASWDRFELLFEIGKIFFLQKEYAQALVYVRRAYDMAPEKKNLLEIKIYVDNEVIPVLSEDMAEAWEGLRKIR